MADSNDLYSSKCQKVADEDASNDKSITCDNCYHYPKELKRRLMFKTQNRNRRCAICNHAIAVVPEQNLERLSIKADLILTMIEQLQRRIDSLENNSGAKKSNSTPRPNGAFAFIRRRKYILIISTIIMLAIFIGIIVSTTKFSKSKQLIGDGDDSRLNIPINSTIGSSVEDLNDDEFNSQLLIMSRSDWLARPPSHELDKLELPVHRVIISHTASDTCMEKDVCIERVHAIQDFHIDSMGWDDIAYNFLIGGDGQVYEGRGWDNQGAHTKGYNTDSIGICFIGTFTTIEPTKRQIMAAKLLIEEGVRQMKVTPDYCMFGARQLVASESPGLALFNIIKTWPHWSNNIKCIGSKG